MTAPRELVVVGEFGPFDALADDAHAAYVGGRAEQAVHLCRVLVVLCRASGDRLTERYAWFIAGLALCELGRYDEALGAAESLIALAPGRYLPFWKAKALALRANASAGRGDAARAIDDLAHAQVLLGELDGRSYNQVSGATITGIGLRSMMLYEASDDLLGRAAAMVDGRGRANVLSESLLTHAEWGSLLVLVGDDDGAAPHFVACLHRATQMRHALRGAADDPSLSAVAEWGRLFALEMLGAHGAVATAFRLIVDDIPLGPHRSERILRSLACGRAHVALGDHRRARDFLMTAQEAAVQTNRVIWSSLADVALQELDVIEHGPHPALERASVRFQQLLRQRWTERSAWFDGLDARVRALRLATEAERATLLSRQDPLTGLYNRRALADRLATARGEQSAVMVDIDHFKRVNDTHSHIVGDRVIVAVGEILLRTVRIEDLPVRYGGDEFLVLLRPEVGVDSARAAEVLAQRIQQEARTFDWSTIAPGLRLSLSVGVASTRSPLEVISEADASLRLAKQAGRDQIIMRAHGVSDDQYTVSRIRG
ncbi:MAG TPA: GGDEF domain-containing protein [Cellulomonadaceae bacterium]|nr:GGDEF domain-containing protein [Cellulomonadaceae bacterium]